LVPIKLYLVLAFHVTPSPIGLHPPPKGSLWPLEGVVKDICPNIHLVLVPLVPDSLEANSGKMFL
jgi:hypothetical protein